jgi:glycosyltransferase involved in cell wall biosynthesis
MHHQKSGLAKKFDFACNINKMNDAAGKYPSNFKSKENSIRLLVVQQINRAYRVPLLKKLSETPYLDLTMVYGTNPPVQAGDVGISVATGSMPFRTIRGPISGLRFKGREILWFGLALNIIRQEYFDVVICDHYTRLLSIWLMQSLQHRRNANFILWGIGFHQHPTPLLDKIRMLMVKRTDALLLYSKKESRRYQKMGVPREKCFVTQNTVDIEGIDAAVSATQQKDIEACRERLEVKESPLLMHVGRLAKNKRLDLLFKTLPNLRKKWPKIKLALIGEGPEHEDLKNLALELSIADSVRFLGPITDHKRLAPWVLASDLFVAPAQVGLMAPMCMIYGKTLIVSNEAEQHGPEVQPFIPGETGLNYKFGDIQDLTRVIDFMLDHPEKCKQFAAAGSAHVRKMMGAEKMLDSFLAAIRYVTGR